jgi:hypothetical protein
METTVKQTQIHLTEEVANHFAKEWIESWNARNLDMILEHYADNLEFYSPFIPMLKFNETGVIRSKAELAAYFQIGLNAYPNLYFNLHNVFIGINTVVLYYTSVNGRMASEVFQLNEKGKAVKVYCNYTMNKSTYN